MVAGLKLACDAPTTLTELLERYLKEVSSKKKGYQDEVYRMRRVMRSDIGPVPLENLQASMCLHPGVISAYKRSPHLQCVKI